MTTPQPQGLAEELAMADDLVDALRAYRTLSRGGHPTICDEAADRIEALSAELASLRGAVEGVDETALVEDVAWAMAAKIAHRHGHQPDNWMGDARREEAREAIKAYREHLSRRAQPKED